ncbi:MAG: hypothetical protein AAFW46_12120 [Pseudomonadota bacterium]
MRFLSFMLGKGVPAYLWIAVFYVIYVGVVAAPDAFSSIWSEEVAPGQLSIAEKVELVLRETLFTIPLFSGTGFEVSWTTLFIIFGFFAAWIEVVRATNARNFSGNDFMSLIVTVIAIVLFVGVSWFGTTAFMIVPLVGIGDLLLDRLVGQAVARRDLAVPGYGSH